MPIESEEQIITLFTDQMDANPEIDFAIIDHISSASALVFPIGIIFKNDFSRILILLLAKLIDECKRRNIIVCIDGAHAPGQIDLHLDDLGADFYVGNFHKWAYVPRGAAILWSDPKYHS